MAVVTALVATGCAVSGQAVAPPAQVEKYTAQQKIERQRASAAAACTSTLNEMRGSLNAYNAMITTLNASQSMDELKGTDRTVAARLSRDVASLRGHAGSGLPDDLAGQMSRTADTAEAVRRAVTRKQRAALNPAAKKWDEARRGLLAVCRSYFTG
ncbi:hypothetical protein [Gordonia araii]|nr:hypothetical protein [Gordonia araii]NNG97932.1 hypothetical protein [Gordonia araii NBRC 100433]